MKGVYSDQVQVSQYEMKRHLFKNGSLNWVSGGDPKAIVNLTAK